MLVLSVIFFNILVINLLFFLWIWQVNFGGAGITILLQNHTPSPSINLFTSIVSSIMVFFLLMDLIKGIRLKDFTKLKKSAGIYLVSFLILGVPGNPHTKEIYMVSSLLQKPKIFDCSYENLDPKFKAFKFKCP